MNTKYVVRPTSQTGQSLLESVARRGNSQIIAEVSIQLPTDKAKEIAKAVNQYEALMEVVRSAEVEVRHLDKNSLTRKALVQLSEVQK
jgi:N-dimethylarginine dimethylaminohydrolase